MHYLSLATDFVFSTVRIAPRPNIPINTVVSNELSTGGTVNQMLKIGDKIVST